MAEEEPFAASGVLAGSPFDSRLGGLPSVRADGGELPVGVVISIGSPGEGADVWIVGVEVIIGIIREAIGSSWTSFIRER